jgi:hypothetical protein
MSPFVVIDRPFVKKKDEKNARGLAYMKKKQ